MKRRIWSILLSLVCLLFVWSVVLAAEPVKNCSAENKDIKQDPNCKEQKESICPNDVRIEKDIPYLEGNIWEKLDLYTPANIGDKQRLPCIVNIHGGGWKIGDKSSLLDQGIAMELARNGYICANIDYTLSTFGPCWPQNLYDCKSAVQFLRKNAELYHVDPNHIGAIGTSAGGHLAAMLGVTGPEVGLEPPGPYKGISSRVQAVVPMYGPQDLNKEFGHYVEKHRFIPSFLGAEKQDDPNLWAWASPVSHVSPDDPPFLLLHGTLDDVVPIEQSIELDKKLRENGIESRLIPVEAGHGFGLQTGQQDLRPAVIAFFDRHLKNKPKTEKTADKN
jgi:acetyl esterase/lipase